MNFFLNKIDNDIRRKIYEKTRSCKVHKKENKYKNKITIRVIKVKKIDKNSKIILDKKNKKI